MSIVFGISESTTPVSVGLRKSSASTSWALNRRMRASSVDLLTRMRPPRGCHRGKTLPKTLNKLRFWALFHPSLPTAPFHFFGSENPSLFFFFLATFAVSF